MRQNIFEELKILFRMIPDKENITTFAKLDDVRCPNCNRLLLKQKGVKGFQEIICGRCGYKIEIVDGGIIM